MAEQAKEPLYDAVLERAKIHLIRAWEEFRADPALRWEERTGDVPKVQVQVWVDALKETLAHHRQIERLQS